MEDDVFGTAVWGASSSPTAPPTVDKPAPPSSKVEPGLLTIPPPPSTNASSDDQFDDFDDFGTAAETIPGEDGDDDFGDFGDFGEGDEFASGFPPDDGAFGEEVRIDDVPPILGPAKPLELDPMPDKHELAQQVNEIMGPIFGEDDMTIMTLEPLREREGLEQILVTPESRQIYNTLLPSNTPPMQPVNWTRSRTRRQHLISLGIPINLDEVLPRALEKLPALQISTRPHSTPPGPRSGLPSSRPGSVNNSRAGSRAGSPSPQLQNHNSLSSAAAQLRLGSKPDIDEVSINGLLDLTPDSMNLLPLSTLESHQANLKLQTVMVSTLLTHLLQTRDALQQDSETYNKLIAELVADAQKKAGSKLKQPSKRGST